MKNNEQETEDERRSGPEVNGPGANENDTLDRALDAVLAKYAAVEPRVGIEERILARLRSEQDRTVKRAWWQWSAVGAVAALLVLTFAMAWRSGKPAKNLVQHSSAPAESIEQPSPPPTIAKHASSPILLLATRRNHAGKRHSVPLAAGSDEPKLDQFPSPRPLTDEEIALAHYVHNFPKEALLIARAQQQEEIEMEKQITQEAATTTGSGVQEER